MAGKVYIVGAGPGDPELLTLRAVRLLGAADVVLHDELVNPEVLEFARADAIVENVGKRSGCKHYPQAAIHASMVFHASEGRCVVRLKGGDPSLFGRLGEELAALREAQIDFEIIPGITAALACAAEARIPLTDRAAAPSVVFLSGHRCSADMQPDWEAAVASGSTIVLYMPGHCGGAAERLMAAGMRSDVPCVIVANASLGNQQVFRATLDGIVDLRINGSPKLMIVGEVTREPEVRVEEEMWLAPITSAHLQQRRPALDPRV
ncbi:MAG: uroporphyrinogen-III C-methyltransferase [Acidobacteriaceae bacterium]|nr:uroporphyrinogen-III C-methyltransferase [Acidobacteriaceae bacterium]MBV9778702.1 uroporphyrinogen-III C-methyltransferase [Acidobacteriaceae bacterium]